jgi:hypothetical protein
MPRKKHSPERAKDADKSKGNLGQREADLQKSGKERLSHMEADETDQAGQSARPKTRTVQGGGQQTDRQRGRG